MEILLLVLKVTLGIAYIIIAVLMCKQESKKRKINFFVALLICLVITPFFGYIIISNIGLRNPKGCKWCNNKYNEAEFCGICKKNDEGLTFQVI